MNRVLQNEPPTPVIAMTKPVSPAPQGPAGSGSPGSAPQGPAHGGPPGSAPVNIDVIEKVWSLLAKQFPTVVHKLEGDGQSLPFTGTVGVLCAGMGNEHPAFARLPWGLVVVFWCENDPVARQFLIDNFGDIPNWSDCTSQEFLDNAPHCNVLIAGFPSHPWSIAGKGQGKDDCRGRALPLIAIIKYIELRDPEFVLLENVAGLFWRHRDVLSELIGLLENMHYYVSWRILDSHTHSGIPHRRSRLYIIALKLSNTWPCLADGGRPAHPMHPRMPPIGSTYRVVWPRPIECQPLSAFLDPGAKIPSYPNYPIHVVARNKTYHDNIVRGLAKVQETARRQGVPAESLEVILDLGGSKVNSGYELPHV